MQDTKKIVELMREGVGGINYLTAVTGDRHILDVPIDLILTHPLFKQIRGKDPSDLAILSSSMKDTEGPVYMPCLYAELMDENSISLYVADGHQRVASAKANGNKTIVCQYMAHWDTAEKAFGDAVGVQFAHFQPVEEDIISILRSGKLTNAEIASKTGLSQSKVSRLAKVAEKPLEWLYLAVKDDILGLSVAGKLVDACNQNPGKLAALQNTFAKKHAEAEQQRIFWENHMKSRKRKWDRKTKEKARIASYFKKMDWDAWVDALESDGGIVAVDNVSYLKLDETATGTKSGVRIGDAADWKNEFAIYGLFEKKIEDVDKLDIDYVVAHWDHIRDMLVAIRDDKPVPSLNPVTPLPTPAPPTLQQPRMTVADAEDDDE